VKASSALASEAPGVACIPSKPGSYGLVLPVTWLDTERVSVMIQPVQAKFIFDRAGQANE